eukprot:TRINITY_DN5117_c0_g1_i1.p1 TRINITY_DN5117_c0_g1~~TRINITY_DN5117_c0_g1_i1.p1  ORF type:complete len:209 (-),score=52.50 TRINITY_DN5117_c0_g1_i1:117-743(-)
MSNENLAPAVVRRILREVNDMTQSPMEGIKVSLKEDDVSEIEALIYGPAGTPYEGGIFKCKLKLGAEFPQAPPKGYFVTKIFHPNVSKIGEICVNTLKKDWKPELGLKHVLLTIKCLLIVPNPESALNEEAGKLLLEHYEDYFKQAKLYTGIHATPKGTSVQSTANKEQEDPASNQPQPVTNASKPKIATKTSTNPAKKPEKKGLKRL